MTSARRRLIGTSDSPTTNILGGLMSADGLSDDPVARSEEDEAASMADRVSRVVEDEALLVQLREVGFKDARADLFRDELIRYGWAVLNALMHSGSVFGRAAQLRRGVDCPERLREQLRCSAEDREDIAAEVVARVLPRFWQNALVDGGWRADGGTAITTYFTNALLLEFSNVLNVWKRQQRTFGVVTDDLPYGIPPHGDVDERSQVLEELRSLKPREREIVALHYDGYTHAEIRELTGATSERAVEGVLYRWRSKHARYREQSGGEQ